MGLREWRMSGHAAMADTPLATLINTIITITIMRRISNHRQWLIDAKAKITNS